VGLELVRDAYVFHAGTAMKGEQLVTNGGRVLGGNGLRQGPGACHRMAAYRNAALVAYEGKTQRMDIGHDLIRVPTAKPNVQKA
jgi:phosphoribosylamine---glycine ligase